MLALLLALHTFDRPDPAPRLHYRLVNSSTVDVGMGMAPLVLTMSAFVAITITDSASGRIADVTINWSRFNGGVMTAPLPGPLMEEATGVTLHVFFVNGRTESITPSVPNLQAMQLVAAIQLLMAGTRSAKPGESWIDSTTADTSVTTASSKATAVTKWTANRGASGAWQFEGAVTGTTTLGAGAMRVEMRTAGSSHVTAEGGQLPITATSSTSGQGTLNLGIGSTAIQVRTDVSATLFPTAAWAQIP